MTPLLLYPQVCLPPDRVPSDPSGGRSLIPGARPAGAAGSAASAAAGGGRGGHDGIMQVEGPVCFNGTCYSQNVVRAVDAYISVAPGQRELGAGVPQGGGDRRYT